MGYKQISFVEHFLTDTFGTAAAWSQRHAKSPVCDRTLGQKAVTVDAIDTADQYMLITRDSDRRKQYEEVSTCYYQLVDGRIVGVCEKFAGFDGFQHGQCKSVMAESFSRCLFAYEVRFLDTFTSVIKELCGVGVDYISTGAELLFASRMELPLPPPPPPKEPPPPLPMPPDGMPPTFG